MKNTWARRFCSIGGNSLPPLQHPPCKYSTLTSAVQRSRPPTPRDKLPLTNTVKEPLRFQSGRICLYEVASCAAEQQQPPPPSSKPACLSLVYRWREELQRCAEEKIKGDIFYWGSSVKLTQGPQVLWTSHGPLICCDGESGAAGQSGRRRRRRWEQETETEADITKPKAPSDTADRNQTWQGRIHASHI